MSNDEKPTSEIVADVVQPALKNESILLDSTILKEDQAEYDFLLAALIEELDPRTPFQDYLVRKIANCIWRSRRISAAETSHINRRLDYVETDDVYIPGFHHVNPNDLDNPEDKSAYREARTRAFANAAGISLIPCADDSAQLLRDEMRLDRLMHRTLRILMQLKLRRKSRPAKKMPKKRQKMGPPFPEKNKPDSPNPPQSNGA